MRTRIITSIVAISLCLVLLSGCSEIVHSFHESPIKTYTYTDDYPALYSDELRQIFGDYSISERRDCNIPGETCSCGYHQDEINYYEWTITYTDCCGQSMECILKNSSPLYAQQIGWLEDQLETHFYTQYVDVYYGDELRENASYCFCFLGSFCNTVSSADDRDQYRFDTTRAYRESIEREEVTIPLYSMSYSELVSRYPMVFSISLVMDPDTTMSEDEFDSISYDMAAVLAEDIGDDLNMSVSTCDREHRSMNGFCILRGEICEHIGSEGLDRSVFESYVGEYW